jgi:hypothetical protein
LLIGIEQLDAVDRSVRRNVHVDFI